jgi:gamma-glutamylcyclotransferase (GGCT)/AIG2-like uncharacterized protein YtfP
MRLKKRERREKPDVTMEAKMSGLPLLDTLFVYGTLRSQCRNRFARLLAERATLVGPARARGRLYRIGSYPGLVPSEAPDEWVTGELYRLHNASALLPILDDYEGCGPRHVAPFEFERIISEALLSNNCQPRRRQARPVSDNLGPRVVPRGQRLDGKQPVPCWLYIYSNLARVREENRIPSGDFINSAPVDNG